MSVHHIIVSAIITLMTPFLISMFAGAIEGSEELNKWMPAVFIVIVTIAFFALTIIFAILQLIAYRIRKKNFKDISTRAKIYPYLVGYGMSIALYYFSLSTNVEIAGKEELVLIPFTAGIFVIFFILNFRQK